VGPGAESGSVAKGIDFNLVKVQLGSIIRVAKYGKQTVRIA